MSFNSDQEVSRKLSSAKQPAPLIITIDSLIVLCGPAGSGKSTFARTFIQDHQAQGFKATSIVSSDICRALVCDDEGMSTVAVDQQPQVQQSTFELFYSILAKRLALRRLSIADTLALHENIRRALLEIARKLNVPTYLLVFNMSLQTCLEHNQHQTRNHLIPEDMITYQVKQLPQVLLSIPHERWDQVRILDEDHPTLEIVIAPSVRTG
jgi:protein phosphatase